MTELEKFTLRDFASIIVEVEGRPNAEKVFNQLKGLSARGLMHPIPDHYGVKGALLFPKIELFWARILMAAIDMGLSSDNLAKLAQDLTEKNVLQSALDDLAKPDHDNWLIEISWIRIPGEESASVYGNWVRGNHRFRPGANPLDADSYTVTGAIEGALSIRFGAIALPILAYENRS